MGITLVLQVSKRYYKTKDVDPESSAIDPVCIYILKATAVSAWNYWTDYHIVTNANSLRYKNGLACETS